MIGFAVLGSINFFACLFAGGFLGIAGERLTYRVRMVLDAIVNCRFSITNIDMIAMFSGIVVQGSCVVRQPTPHEG